MDALLLLLHLRGKRVESRYFFLQRHFSTSSKKFRFLKRIQSKIFNGTHLDFFYHFSSCTFLSGNPFCVKTSIISTTAWGFPHTYAWDFSSLFPKSWSFRSCCTCPCFPSLSERL